jgi:hypothetical protein
MMLGTKFVKTVDFVSVICHLSVHWTATCSAVELQHFFSPEDGSKHL